MTEAAPVEGQPAEGATPDVDEPLGEPGKKALVTEREARAAEKARADALEAKIREYEDRDKSEEQKRQEERDRLERELADLTVAKNRAEISSATAVPVEVLSGPASGSAEDIQAFAEKLVAWRGEQAPQTLHVPREGSAPAVALNGDALEATLKQALGIN